MPPTSAASGLAYARLTAQRRSTSAASGSVSRRRLRRRSGRRLCARITAVARCARRERRDTSASWFAIDDAAVDDLELAVAATFPMRWHCRTCACAARSTRSVQFAALGRRYRRAHAAGARRSCAEPRCMTFARLDAGSLTRPKREPLRKRCWGACSCAESRRRNHRRAYRRDRGLSLERSRLPRLPRQAARATPRCSARRIVPTSIKYMERRSASIFPAKPTGRARACSFARSSRSKVSRSCAAVARVEAARDLCRGPGRLCRALAIDRSFDGVDLLTRSRTYGWRRRRGSPRASGAADASASRMAANRRLRFYEAGNPYVSGPARLSPA